MSTCIAQVPANNLGRVHVDTANGGLSLEQSERQVAQTQVP
jgi:hypothetical protein